MPNAIKKKITTLRTVEDDFANTLLIVLLPILQRPTKN